MTKLEEVKKEMEKVEREIEAKKQELRGLTFKMLKQELLKLWKEMEEENNPNRDTIVFGEYQIMKEIVDLWK